jgi:hypothetical protein
LIAFLQNDAMGRPQINVLDTLAPAVVRELTAGPIDFNGTVPSFVITVYRWFPGLPELSWGFNDAAGRLQIRAVDLQNFSAPPRDITDEPHDHVDSFPAVLGSEAILVGGVDSTAVGALYTRANATSPFRIQRRFEQVSQLVNPMMAASFEPFQRQGRRFASDIVLDGGRGPGAGGRGTAPPSCGWWTSTRARPRCSRHRPG